MYHDNQWTQVQGDQLKGFLSQVEPIDGNRNTSLETTQVHWRVLPFYEGVALIRVKDTSWVPSNLYVYYLTIQGELYRLDGASLPIHQVNQKEVIRLNDDTVLDYLRFFCYFVRGADGPFLIVDDLNNPHLPKDMDAKTRKAIEGTVREASIESKDPNGNYLCEGIVYYHDSLFIARFVVQTTGIIEMLEDQPVAQGLADKIDSPIR